MSIDKSMVWCRPLLDLFLSELWNQNCEIIWQVIINGSTCQRLIYLNMLLKAKLDWEGEGQSSQWPMGPG